MQFGEKLLRDAVNVGLEMVTAKGTSLEPLDAAALAEQGLDARAEVYALPDLPPSWERTLDSLRAPKQGNEPDWVQTAHAHRRGPRSPASRAPVVQRLLSRFLSQGYSAHDLSRVTIIPNDRDGLGRLIAFGRISLFGPGATRLHDEVFSVAAQWLESRADGHLRPFADQADRRALTTLEDRCGNLFSLLRTDALAHDILWGLHRDIRPAVRLEQHTVQRLLPHLSSRYDDEMMADLVGLAHEHATRSHFEAAVLDWLGAHVGFDVGFFSVKGDEAFPTVTGLPPELVQRAVRRGPTYFQELLPVMSAALAARGVAVDTDVLGERRVHQTAYYRELARRVGGRHSLMAYVPLRGRVVAGIMLGRCGAAFSNEEVARVEAVLPALGVARSSYGLPVRFDPLTVPSRGPQGLLERLGLGREPEALASSVVGDTTISVRDRGGFREMVASSHGAELVWTRAALHDPSESGWPYVDLLHLAAVQARARQRALFIGCGGAVALRQFARVYPGLALDLVERERSVIELARTWYDLDAIPGLSVHVADGAEFVERAAPASWDIAVVDAFDASEPASALTRRPFLSAIHRSLRPGGALGINVIGTLDGPGPVRSLVNSLRSSFDSVRVVPVLELDEAFSASALRNVVVIAIRKR